MLASAALLDTSVREVVERLRKGDRMRRRLAAMALVVGVVGNAPAETRHTPASGTERATGRLVIVPMPGGRRLDPALDAAVEVRLTRLDPRDPHAKHTLNRRSRTRGGEIEVADVPIGTWSLRLAIDVNPGNGLGYEGMPGDERAITTEPWSLTREGETLRREVPTERLIRMRLPEDTEHGVARASREYPSFHGPIDFAWDPVPGATRYEATISLSPKDGRPRLIREARLESPQWRVDLPPLEAPGLYALRLDAHATSQIGTFRVEGPGWYSYAYHFRVVDADTPLAPVESAGRRLPDVLEGRAHLEITPTLDGRPIDGLAGTPATVVLLRTDPFYRTVRDVVAGDGTVEVSELPEGAFRPRLFIDLDPGPGYGDCSSVGAGTSEPEDVVLANGRPARRELPVTCAIRLTTPDPAAQTYHDGVVGQALPRALTFAWTPVPGARRYRYQVTRMDSRQTSQEVAAGDVSGTTWSTTLDPSMPGSSYRFTVSAYGEREQVGKLLVRIPRGHGTIVSEAYAYAFRVAGAEIQPGKARVILVPTYDGRPLDPTLDVPVDLHLGRRDAGTVDDRTARLVGGTVDAGEVETGVYRTSIRLDLSSGADDARLPRHLFMPHSQEVVVLRDGEDVRAEVELHESIVTADLGAEPALRSPVTIDWEPVRGARSYDIHVVRVGDGADRPFERRETVTSARWQGELPSSNAGSSYFLSITARTERAAIASTALHFVVQ